MNGRKDKYLLMKSLKNSAWEIEAVATKASTQQGSGSVIYLSELSEMETLRSI